MNDQPYTHADILEVVGRNRAAGDNYTATVIETLYDRLTAMRVERNGAAERADAHAASAGDMLRRIDEALDFKPPQGAASVFMTIDAIKRLRDRLDVAEAEAAGAIERADEQSSNAVALFDEAKAQQEARFQRERDYTLLAEENERLRAEIAELRREVEAKADETAQARAGVVSYATNLKDAQDRIKGLEIDLRAVRANYARSLETNVADIEGYQARIAELESNYAAARGAADAMEREVVTMREQWQKAVDAERAQDAENQRLTFRVRELEGTCSLLRSHIEKLQDEARGSIELQEARSRARAAESNVAEMLDFRRDVVAQNASLMQRCTELEAELATARDRLGFCRDFCPGRMYAKEWARAENEASDADRIGRLIERLYRETIADLRVQIEAMSMALRGSGTFWREVDPETGEPKTDWALMF